MLKSCCSTYNFCSITAKLISNLGALPSLWLAALADPPGEEVPLPEALVRAEDVRGHGTAGAHPQGNTGLLSWVVCGGMGRENELYLPPSTSHSFCTHQKGEVTAFRKLVLIGVLLFAPSRVMISYHGRISAVTHFVLIFREDKRRNLEFIQHRTVGPS